MSFKVSVEGLEKIHGLRIKKQWKRQDPRWCEAANVSLNGLKRFLGRVAIAEDAFKAICLAVGLEDWQEIAEIGESSQRKSSPKSNKSTNQQLPIAKQLDRTR
jgi:hypothetical protein